MYSRKEKQMARKNDPFAVERRAKKKEKPEKRQNDTFSAKGFGFESKDSVSFGGESKKEKPKKEPKAAKAPKESSFGFEEKKKAPETKGIFSSKAPAAPVNDVPRPATTDIDDIDAIFDIFRK